VRRLVSMWVLGFLCLAGTAGAQGALTLGRAPVQRRTLVPLRPELLQPIGAATLESLRVRSGSAAPAERAEPGSPGPAQVRSMRVCPMPVARRDSTALERMPVGTTDSTRTASMPVMTGCMNPLSR
jgi:hypothetical protein